MVVFQSTTTQKLDQTEKKSANMELLIMWKLIKLNKIEIREREKSF